MTSFFLNMIRHEGPVFKNRHLIVSDKLQKIDLFDTKCH